MSIAITEANYEQEVLRSDVPVLLDFWAPWCGPCRIVGPVVEQIADDFQGRLKVGKVNTDEEPALAAQFRVMSIPTIVLMRNGQPAATCVGARPKEDLLARLGL